MAYLAGHTYAAPGAAPLNTQVFVTDYLSAMPFPVYGKATFTGMGMWITTAATATTCDVLMGAYRDNGDGYPGDIIAAGVISGLTTGSQSVTGLTIPADNEILWLAAAITGTGITAAPQCVGMNTNTAVPVFGVPTVPANNPFIGASWTLIYANDGGLPATFPAGAGPDEGSWAIYLAA